MDKVIYISAAAFAYLICSVNPAIEISKRVYKKDIRTCNSGNPGFTNFKRSFGIKWAIPVLLFDLLKAAIIIIPFAILFDKYISSFSFGAAYTGIFCMLGHSYPLYYRFKGGKGFLVYMSMIFFVDPIAGSVALAVLCLFLITFKYMSLATMLAVLSSVISLIILDYSIPIILICFAQVLFIILRHKENIERLLQGKERKFYFKGNKSTQI